MAIDSHCGLPSKEKKNNETKTPISNSWLIMVHFYRRVHPVWRQTWRQPYRAFISPA
jgi:hypothetical protein